MTINTRFAIVIQPATIKDNTFVPAQFRFVQSETCPLGNTKCSFHSANITHCVRGGTDGIHTVCLCKPVGHLRENDVSYFYNQIRQIGGEVMLSQIRAQLRNNVRRG